MGDDRCDICCRPRSAHKGRDLQCDQTTYFRPMPDRSLPGDVGTILDRIADGMTWNSSPLQCIDRIGQIVKEERAALAALTPSALSGDAGER